MSEIKRSYCLGESYKKIAGFAWRVCNLNVFSLHDVIVVPTQVKFVNRQNCFYLCMKKQMQYEIMQKNILVHLINKSNWYLRGEDSLLQQAQLGLSSYRKCNRKKNANSSNIQLIKWWKQTNKQYFTDLLQNSSHYLAESVFREVTMTEEKTASDLW